MSTAKEHQYEATEWPGLAGNGVEASKNEALQRASRPATNFRAPGEYRPHILRDFSSVSTLLTLAVIQLGVSGQADGSCELHLGNTRVLAVV